MSKVEKGLYRHYKGNTYSVLHIGLHTETMEEMVVYRDTADDSKIWIRPLSMWNDIVEVNGKKQLRFEKIAE